MIMRSDLDEAGGVAGDHEFLVGGDDEGQDWAGAGDAAVGCASVVGVRLGVLRQAQEA